MHRFVKKRKPVEHISSAQPIVRGETEISRAEEHNLILQLQRALGNQAVQKTLQPGPLARSGMRSAGEYALVQCLPDHPADRIMRQGLSAQTVTKWQSLVSAGFQEERQNNLKGMAANFAEALKLIGEPNVHVTTNGHADIKKLKPGINLDILFKEKPGRAGFLTKQEFTATLPMDATDPDSAILIGRNAFQSNSPIWTITVLEHEKTHMSHQRSSASLLKEWAGKADMKKFEKEFQKKKTDFERGVKKSSMDTRDKESRLAEIKARMVREWFIKKKGQVTPEVELLYEQLGTMKTDHFDSEVLSGLAGFMKGFPLVEHKNGVPAQDIFHELTHYPVEKGFWKLNSEAVKKQYQQTLTDLYCKTLNDPQKKVFDKHLVEYKNKKWQVDASKYFRMLEGITCKR